MHWPLRVEVPGSDVDGMNEGEIVNAAFGTETTTPPAGPCSFAASTTSVTVCGKDGRHSENGFDELCGR